MCVPHISSLVAIMRGSHRLYRAAGEIWTRRVTLRGCIMVNGTSNGDSHRKRSSLSLSRSFARARVTLTHFVHVKAESSSRCLSLHRLSRVFVFFKPLRLYHGCGYTRRTSARRTLKRAIKPYRRFSEGDLHLGLMGAIFIS